MAFVRPAKMPHPSLIAPLPRWTMPFPGEVFCRVSSFRKAPPWHGRWQAALELGCSTALLVVLPPITAFTLYFCLMHGARHILRSLAQEDPAVWPLLFGLSVLAMLGVLLMAAGGWWLMADALLEERVIRLVFIGLAALTLPHLLLVEPMLSGNVGRAAASFGWRGRRRF